MPLLFQTLLMRGSLHSEYQNESTHMRKVHVCFNHFSILHPKNSKDLRFCQFQDFVNFDIKFWRFVWTQNSTVRRQRFSAAVELFWNRRDRAARSIPNSRERVWNGCHPRPSPHAAAHYHALLSLPVRAPRCKNRFVLTLPRSPEQGRVFQIRGGCSAVKFRAWVFPVVRAQCKQAPVFAAASGNFNLNLSSVAFGATLIPRKFGSRWSTIGMERLKRKTGHHSLRRDNKAVLHSLVHMEFAQKALFPGRFQCRATSFRWTLGSRWLPQGGSWD